MKKMKLFFLGFLLISSNFYCDISEESASFPDVNELMRDMDVLGDDYKIYHDLLDQDSSSRDVGKVLIHAYHKLSKIVTTSFSKAVLELINPTMLTNALLGDLDSQFWICDALQSALRKDLKDFNFVDFTQEKELWTKQDQCVGIRKNVNIMLLDLQSLSMTNDFIVGVGEIEEDTKGTHYEMYFSRIEDFFERLKIRALKSGRTLSELFQKKVLNNLSSSNVEFAFRYIAHESSLEGIRRQQEFYRQKWELFELLDRDEKARFSYKEKIDNTKAYKEIIALRDSLNLTDETLNSWNKSKSGEVVVEEQLLCTEFFLTIFEKDLFKNMVDEWNGISEEYEEVYKERFEELREERSFDYGQDIENY